MVTHHWPTPRPPGRAVVLGGTGLVGRNLVRHLQDLAVPTLALSSRDVDLVAPDAADRVAALLRAEDALVFVSALTPDKGRDIATLMKNLAMGQQVCAAVTKAPCAHVIYVSSDAVYADNANPVRETSCCEPSSYHGLNHLVRERMLTGTLAARGTPLLLIRPSLLYGPGDTHNSYGPNRFLRTAAAERKITLFGKGEEKRDHVFVGDLSRLIGLCLFHRSAGVLNVATGHAVSFRDVAVSVAAATGGHVDIVPSPRANPITHRHFDITATARSFPGFRFTALAEGLARSCQAC